jgi:hypothetical protein
MNLPLIAAFLRWLALFFDPEHKAAIQALEVRLQELHQQRAELSQRGAELDQRYPGMWS